MDNNLPIIQVQAKYLNNPKNTDVLMNIASVVAGTGGFVPGLESGNAIAGEFNEGIIGNAIPLEEETVPDASLNYLLYDKNMQLVDFGYASVGPEAKENHQQLDLQVTPQQEGYLYIYTANETKSNQNVFFDDLTVTQISSELLAAYDYYPFGLPFADPAVLIPDQKNLYQDKEWQDEHDLDVYDFHARMFDPALGRFYGVDPQGQFMPYNSPYVGMMNNPIKYVDPDGELPFLAIVAIGAAVFGTTNVAVQAANEEINNFWDGLEAFGSGAVAGVAITAGVTAGFGVPVLGTVIKGAGIVYGGTLAVGTLSGLGDGIFNGDWDRLQNTGKLLAGNFYLDGNRNFFGQTLQGIGRFSWELPQSTIGHGYSQVRNAFGGTDRIDYFGGATFSTAENQDIRHGVSIANFINLNIRNEITGSFEDRVISDPLFMHEYGHTFDSQIFGPFYLPVVGLPSLISAATSRPLPGVITTHSIRWYERNANKHAARYFGKHYGVDWSIYEPPRGRFPRRQP